MDETQKAFQDFQQNAKTDGGYLGRMKMVSEQEQHLESKLDNELKAVNSRLKASRVNVSIRISGKSLQLRATLPLKPTDTDTKGTGTKQYDISLSIPANFDGLKTAEEEAYELGKLLARKQFEWTDKYLGKTKSQSSSVTIGQLLENFEKNYFLNRKRTLKSENTFQAYKYIATKHLSPLDIASEKNFINAVKNENLKETVRNELIKVVRVLCKCSGLEVPSLAEFKKKNETQRERKIPIDKEILNNYFKFREYADTRPSKLKVREDRDNWQFWQWVYGMIATYGLRPREIFVFPDLDWWISVENKDNTWKVSKETKTGYRETLPLYPEWVEYFDLKNQNAINFLKLKICNKVTAKELNAVRHGVDFWFRRVNISFNPYDLRHAWAIRAHLLGIPIKAAADNLGHSVDIHTRIYQKWFSLENRKFAINQAISKKSEIEILQEENVKLKAEIEMLKKILIENQIENLLK